MLTKSVVVDPGSSILDTSSGSQYIACSTSHRNVHLLDKNSFALQTTIRSVHSQRISQTVLVDENFVFTSSLDGFVKCTDLRSQKIEFSSRISHLICS